MEFNRVLEVLGAFEKEGVRYVLIGGVAINLHGLARATKDIDLFLSPEPENVEKAKEALRAVFQDPEIDAISASDLAGDYPVIRYGPPNDPFVIDLISRFGTAFAFADLEAEDRIIEGVRVRLATPAHALPPEKGYRPSLGSRRRGGSQAAVRLGGRLMAVQRFRSFQEAEDALWGRGDDPAHLRSVAWVWAFADSLSPPRCRPGVRRYRSLDAAQQDRDDRSA